MKTPLLNPVRIREALAYVHHWEARERGSERRACAAACAEAIQIFNLTVPEAGILRNVLRVETR